jgi:hypothetical protein
MAGHSDTVLEGMQAPSIDSLLDCSEEVSLTIVLFVVVVIMNLAKKICCLYAYSYLHAYITLLNAYFICLYTTGNIKF